MRSEEFPQFTGIRQELSRVQDAASSWLVFCSLILLSLAPLQLLASSPGADSKLEEKIWTVDGGQLEDLESTTARLIQTQPDSAYAHYLLAQLYLRQFQQNPSHIKLLKQASELGQQAIELSPNLDYGYLIASQVLDIMGYGDNAFGILNGDDKVKLQGSWRIDFMKAQLLTAKKSHKEAIAKFQASLADKDALPNVIVPSFIDTLQAKYSGEELIDQLQVLEQRYKHKLFAYHLALAHTEQEHYQAAHAIYQNLEKTDPDFAEASAQDGILLYAHLGKGKEAEMKFQKLLEAKLSSRSKSLIKAHLASLLLNDSKEPLTSQKYFLEAIVDGPEVMQWISFSQIAYEKHKRLHDFVSLLEQVRLKVPASGYLYALQGEVQSEDLAQHKLAIESFRSAIVLDPERSEFYNGLGLTYYRMNDFSEALKVFLQAIRVDPQDATSRYNHACVLAILGRQDEALGSLKEAIGLDPRLIQTARSDKDFEKLREMQGFRFLTDPRSTAVSRP